MRSRPGARAEAASSSAPAEHNVDLKLIKTAHRDWNVCRRELDNNDKTRRNINLDCASKSCAWCAERLRMLGLAWKLLTVIQVQCHCRRVVFPSRRLFRWLVPVEVGADEERRRARKYSRRIHLDQDRRG
eukprot:1470409-Pleurochrysis_carterae.AAC.1